MSNRQDPLAVESDIRETEGQSRRGNGLGAEPAAAVGGSGGGVDDISEGEQLLRSHFHALEVSTNGHAPSARKELMGDEQFLSPEDDALLVCTHGGKTEVARRAISARERLWLMTMFTTTASLLYADQNLMAPNLSLIAADFGFDAKQRDRMLGGFIAAAFYLVGAPAALLFGWLSDRCNRKYLLFAAVILGESPTVLTVFVTHYWQLLTIRVLTGIALGGALPVVFSLLGDLYDASSRAGVSSIVQLSTGVGLAVGQGVAGFVGPAIGWRWPFLIVSLPAVAVSFVMLFTCREPLRGGTEAALQQRFQDSSRNFVYKEQMSLQKLGTLLVIPTNVLVICQGLFGCLPWGMILVFLNDFLSQDKGLTVQQATVVLLVLGIGGAVGVMGGGCLGQWLYNRRKWSMSVFIGGCTVVGTLPMYYLINADATAVWPLTVMMAFLAGALSGTVGPNMRAMMLNVNEPETRGMALALQTMLDDLGKGLGPVFVAAFIQRLGRVAAFNLSTAGWIPCGLLLLGTAATLAKDEHQMQRRLGRVLSSYTLSSNAFGTLSDAG